MNCDNRTRVAAFKDTQLTIAIQNTLHGIGALRR